MLPFDGTQLNACPQRPASSVKPVDWLGPFSSFQVDQMVPRLDFSPPSEGVNKENVQSQIPPSVALDISGSQTFATEDRIQAQTFINIIIIIRNNNNNNGYYHSTWNMQQLLSSYFLLKTCNRNRQGIQRIEREGRLHGEVKGQSLFSLCSPDRCVYQTYKLILGHFCNIWDSIQLHMPTLPYWACCVGCTMPAQLKGEIRIAQGHTQATAKT